MKRSFHLHFGEGFRWNKNQFHKSSIEIILNCFNCARKCKFASLMIGNDENQRKSMNSSGSSKSGKIKDFCIFNYAFLSFSLIIIMILLPMLKIFRCLSTECSSSELKQKFYIEKTSLLSSHSKPMNFKLSYYYASMPEQ